MKKYIFGERNGIYIIDLQKTLKGLEDAHNFIRGVALTGMPVLFVGTKKQAQDSIQEESVRASAFYVNQRWLGGMLTNFSTIKKSIERLKKIDSMKADGILDLLPKKEVEKIADWSADPRALESAIETLEGSKRLFSRNMMRAIGQLGIKFLLVPVSAKTNEGLNNVNTILERILVGGEKYTY